MQPPWENGLQRIEQLLIQRSEARELLVFYQSLLMFQKNLYARLEERDFSGSISRDLPLLSEYLRSFLDWTSENGSPLLRSEAQEIIGWQRGRQEELLQSYWRSEALPGGNFFPKAFLQPYAACLVRRRITMQDRHRSDTGCPLCGAPPQLSYLQSPPSTGGSASEGASRYLLCSLCFGDWPVNRIYCPQCKEVDPEKLPYFQSEELPPVRIEACDSCKGYLKGVDLTRSGQAVPLVDDIATPALDVWARERGYHKLELNLAGL